MFRKEKTFYFARNKLAYFDRNKLAYFDRNKLAYFARNKLVYLKTFGCQANLADSQRIRQVFWAKGYRETKNIKSATIVIINSCLVRQSAENRVYGLINNLKKLKPQPKIILTGCLAGCILGKQTDQKTKILLRKKIPPGVEIIPIEKIADFTIKPKRDQDTALIPISQGCSHFCSYCIVPYARGQEISRPAKEIIQEVKKVVKKGFKKILLLGQNVNSYGKDLPSAKINSFPKLLERIAKIKGAAKIEFLSANPWDFSDELIKVIAKNRNISRIIHLPLQSGDDQILKKMNRFYTAKQYLNLIQKIKKTIPKVKFTTDIIVGFPGETEKQFQNTVKLCQKIGFKKAFIAKYSPRPNTLAATLPDDVSPEEKKRRWQILENLINKN